MIKTSTSPFDLIRYAYNETNLADADRVQRSIDGDPLVQHDFNELVQLTGILDSAHPEPSEKSIEKILQYS